MIVVGLYGLLEIKELREPNAVIYFSVTMNTPYIYAQSTRNI